MAFPREHVWYSVAIWASVVIDINVSVIAVLAF